MTDGLSSQTPVDPTLPPAGSAESVGWDIPTILEEANRIASMTSLGDLLEQMLDLMIRITGATSGTLYLLDPDAHELVFMVVRGSAADQSLKGNRIPENTGIVGAAILQRLPIVIEDLARDPRWYRQFDPELMRRLHNAITLPLLMQGKAIGAVQIFNFVHAELQLLQILGSRMASEVDKTLLLEKTRRSNKRLQALVNVLGQIGAVLDRDKLLKLVTEQVTSLLDAQRSSVYLIDTDAAAPGLITHRFPEDHPALPGQPVFPTAGTVSNLPGFSAGAIIAAPLHARTIVLGHERSQMEERVIGGLMVYDKPQGHFDAEDSQLLEILANQASTILQIATLYGEANQLFLDFIDKVLTAIIDARDPYTQGHSQRVSQYTLAIASKLGIKSDALLDLRVGSLLHDIGKLGIPDQILSKPGKLTDEEYTYMKRHPAIGFKIMDKVELLSSILPAILEHHERLDGSGYPMGLREDQISLMGRIVAVADVYDALTTDRPYRKALEKEAALAYMCQNIGTMFDATCVEALSDHLLNFPSPSEPPEKRRRKVARGQ